MKPYRGARNGPGHDAGDADAARYLEEFVYRVSHDLQEPARTVDGFARLLAEDYADRLDARGREYLAFLLGGAERLTAMLAHLTALSRVTTHGRPMEPVSLAQAVTSARARLAEDLSRTGGRVRHGPLPTVLGDAVQLTDVFEHLFDNAVKYRGDGPPRIHVVAREQGDAWRVVVRDEGLGLDPMDAEQAFAPFRRLAPTAAPGDGMGLALSRRILERHGGHIGLDPAPDGGAAIWLTLPKPAGHGA